MGGPTRCLAAEFLDNFVLMQHEPAGVEIVVIIEQVDEFLQFIGKQQRAELAAKGFLNIDQGMLSIEVVSNECLRARQNFAGLLSIQGFCRLAEPGMPLRPLAGVDQA